MRYKVSTYLYCCDLCENELTILAVSPEFADDQAIEAGWAVTGDRSGVGGNVHRCAWSGKH